MIRQNIRTIQTSAALLVTLATMEGFVGVAEPPIPGDRPTYGFGMTWLPDGSPVKVGDRVDPVTALRHKLEYVEKDKNRLNQCVHADVFPYEVEALQDHSYQYGVGATCGSTLVKLLNQGKYSQSCEEHLKWRFFQGFDCSTPGNKRCMGVWTRAQQRYQTCMGVS